MIPRVLEPEVMDTETEAVDYDAMDHGAVNRVFVDDFLAAWQAAAACGSMADGETDVLDVGTGTAQVPIELCRRDETFAVMAIDLAAEMLKVARRNVALAELEPRIRLDRVDAKSLPFADRSFDAVISNSIVHHIPDPVLVLAEMRRVLRPGGLLFVRDLLRPPDAATVDCLVETYAGDANGHQRQMFRDSLHAALTLQEVEVMLSAAGLPDAVPTQTTDRHWTVSCRR